MYNFIEIIFILIKMNLKYGNSNNNIFQNLNTNNINNQNNFNMNHNIGMNNYNNNNSMNILLQYINLMNLNKLNKNPMNINTTNNNINNNNIFNNKNIPNSLNILQLMPNIIKFGFNQPYSFSNTKKESSIIHPSNFKNKLYYKNKETFSNNFNDKDFDTKSDDECNERKFMRKMTKAEKIEIDKWFEARKKLYPTKKNIELKKKIGEIKVEKGLVSDLELKLRKKVNILKKLNSSKKIKIRNKFNKEFPNFQKRKKEILEKNQQSNKKEENKIDNNSQSNIDNTQKDKEKEVILEDGEIEEEILSNQNEEEKNNENNKENNINLLGKKRERKSNNIKKKLGKNKKEIKENKNEFGFKKGFKYKSNNLYDELIKKEKIKEQNILLQAIRYLINLKEE